MAYKFIDCEIGERHYLQSLVDIQEREVVNDTPLAKITPDKQMAFRITRAFNTLGYLKPHSLTSYHKRAAFLTALNAMGINYRIDYAGVFGPKIFINDAHGEWIDIHAA